MSASDEQHAAHEQCSLRLRELGLLRGRLADYEAALTGAHQQIIGKGDEQYALKINPSGAVEFFVFDQNGGQWGWRTVSAPMGETFSVRERHVAGVYDGSTLRLYIDGQEAASSPARGVRLRLHRWMRRTGKIQRRKKA